MNYFNKILEQEKRILIFGKNGQLGKTFSLAFPDDTNIIQLGSKDLNFLTPHLIPPIIRDFKPHFIINTSAYTNVNKAEINPQEAFAINSEALKIISDSAKINKSFLIHYSTDYVFDGSKNKKYKPKDIPNPKNIYGKSKLNGEQHIFKSGCDFFIFRISWLMSEYGINFIKTIMSKIQKEDEIFVINDQIGSPISSNLVAEITAEFIASRQYEKYNKIFHLSTKGEVSWYDIAIHIYNIMGRTPKNIKIIPVKSIEYPSKAFRPKNSLFDHSDIEKALCKILPFWKDDITPIIKKLNSNTYL